MKMKKYIYKAQDKKLLILGTIHTNNPSDSQFNEIKKQIKKFNPEIVYVEGTHNKINRELSEKKVKNFGEISFASIVAKKLKIPVRSWEQKEKEIIKELENNFSKEEIFLYYILRNIPRGIRLGEPTELLKKEIEYLKSITKWKKFDYSLDHLNKINKKLFEKDICLYEYEFYDFCPAYLIKDKSSVHKINYLCEKASKIRNEEGVKKIRSALKKHKKILAIMGKTHARGIVKLLREDSKNPWQNWKNKTPTEKSAIKKIEKAKEKILKAIPKKELVAIYIKGSFTRREMNSKSDIDIVPIVTKKMYQKDIFNINSAEISPCMVVPLSLQELKSNKLSTKPKRKIELRAKPDDFLRKIDKFMLIYGKPINPKKYKIRNPEQILKDEINVLRKGYIPYFESGEISFEPLLKEVFWMTEAELDYQKIPHEDSFEGIARAIKDKRHPIKTAIKLRKRKNISEKEIQKFVKQLKGYFVGK